MPGLQPGSPVGGAQEETTHGCFSPSLSPSLLLSLEINKIFLKTLHLHVETVSYFVVKTDYK